MATNLNESLSETLIQSFNELLTLMNQIQTPELFEEFAIWRSEFGISNLLRCFIETEQNSPPKEEENEKNGSEDHMDDGVSQFIRSDHDGEEQSSLFLPSEIESKLVKKDKKKRYYKRGPYRKYTYEEKKRAVEFLKSNIPAYQISKELDIPMKNIKRWSEIGLDRKDTRKKNSLEEMLLKKIEVHFMPGSEVTISSLKKIGFQYGDEVEQRVSQDWLLKFIDNYQLHKKYKIVI